MDSDFCGLDNGDGCGRLFPNKTSPGLCAKCHKLSTLVEGSPEYEQFKVYRQCESCGIAWKNLDSVKCARCAKSAAGPPLPRVTGPGPEQASLQSLTRIATETAHASRSHAMDARIKKLPLHTTAGLTAAKTGMNTGENKIFITAECRIKSAAKKDQKTTDPDCGQWGKPWSKETYLSEVLDDYLATLNVSWASNHGMELERDEVEFRWAGNKLFLPGDSSRPVGEVYNLYQTGDMAHFYSASGSRPKKASSAQPQFTMALELYIDRPKFISRQKATHRSNREGLLSIRKRSATITEYPGSEVPRQKRQAAIMRTGGMVSTYVRTNCAVSVVDQVSIIIQFQKAHTTCDIETGEVSIQWPTNASVSEGILGENLFASGATKNVYELSIGSDRFVAKQFFETGSEAEVTASENKKYLEDELIRLNTAAWFLKKFKCGAKECNVEFSSDISVSDGFLIREIGEPSGPSSFPPLEQAVWLVEPRRTKSVRKFSGTLVHPNRHDKLGLTLSAFTHFVYESSDNQIVFADVQGSPMHINGRDNLVLFDLMSHSHDGDSGIGDHGLEGINTFVSQHKCNFICQGLKLDVLAEQVPNPGAEDNHGSDDNGDE